MESQVCTDTCTRSHAHTHSHSHIHPHTSTYTHTHTHTHNTHIHTRTHTHTHVPRPTHARPQLRAGVDDPLDSGAVHFGNGLLGTMMLAFFAKPEHVSALVGTPCGGVFYTSHGWMQLGMQTLGGWRRPGAGWPAAPGRGAAACEVAVGAAGLAGCLTLRISTGAPSRAARV